MFKTIIKFNSDYSNIIESVVKMFEETNLIVSHNVGEIIITDNGGNKALGAYWLVFFELKREGIVNRSIFSEFLWFEGGVNKDLLTDFFEV